VKADRYSAVSLSAKKAHKVCFFRTIARRRAGVVYPSYLRGEIMDTRTIAVSLVMAISLLWIRASAAQSPQQTADQVRQPMSKDSKAITQERGEEWRNSYGA